MKLCAINGRVSFLQEIFCRLCFIGHAVLCPELGYMLNVSPCCGCAPWLRITCSCCSSALTALCRGIPLSLQLQFTSRIARHQGCKRRRVCQKERQHSHWQVAVVHVWVMFLCAYAHMCMSSSVAPPTLFLWHKALSASEDGWCIAAVPLLVC